MDEHFSFEGRIGALEFFLCEVAEFLLTILIYAFWVSVTPLPPDNPVFALVRLACGIAWIALFWTNTAAIVKRFHDFDYDGYNWFFLWIPLYNIILTVRLHFQGGTQGGNRYGLRSNDFKFKAIATANLFIPLIVALYVLNARVIPFFSPSVPLAPTQSTATNTHLGIGALVPTTDLETLVYLKGLKAAPIKSFVESAADMYLLDEQVRIGEKTIAWSNYLDQTGAVSTVTYPYNPDGQSYNKYQHSFYLGRMVFDTTGTLIEEESVLTDEELEKAYEFYPPYVEPEIKTTDDGSRIETQFNFDGSISLRYHYDSEDKLLEQERFIDGVLSYHSFYDDLNHLNEVLYDESGKQRVRTVHVYNQEGYVVQRLTYDSEDEFMSQVDQRYNDSNGLVESLLTTKDGTQVVQLDLSYDDQNRMIKRLAYTESGKLYTKIEVDYAEDNTWTQSYIEFNSEEQALYETITRFAENYDVIESNTTVTDIGKESDVVPTAGTTPTTRLEHHFDEERKLIKLETVKDDASEEVLASTTYHYNNNDDLTERIFQNELITNHLKCDYFYDRYSNWTKRTCIVHQDVDGEPEPQYDFSPSEVTYRDISYY